MKRNDIIYNSISDISVEHKRRIAFHEAGHATAIYFNTKNNSLPSVFFQIKFKNLNSNSAKHISDYQTVHGDSIATVEGGRLINLLPATAEEFADKFETQQQTAVDFKNAYKQAFEMDIINLLVGPLAEAKHVADTDDELFNKQLVNLKALRNYGGASDLGLVDEYMQTYSNCKLLQEQKLNELLAAAHNFVSDRTYWGKIAKLANYIMDSNKNLISCEEVITILE